MSYEKERGPFIEDPRDDPRNACWCQICLLDRVYTASCDHVAIPARIARDRERLIDEARD